MVVSIIWAAEAYLRWHLDPSNRLATIHQRYSLYRHTQTHLWHCWLGHL